MKTHRLNTVNVEVEGTIVTVVLNRPDRLNALNSVMIEELTDTFSGANNDQSVRAVIVTGSGDRAFCSGADLTQEHIGESERYDQYLREYYHPLIRTIVESPKPYVAALNGIVVGAGIGLALACDYIIAVPETEFHMAFAKIGLVPDTGVMSFVTHHIGRHKAFDLAASAGVVSAREALDAGMINEITDRDRLSDAAVSEAKVYARMPALAVGLIKQMSHAALSLDLEEMFDLERKLQQKAAADPDHMEGVRAFLEKRAPKFSK